ncbi:MAG: outer membrane protein assembly factor BamD, partial [Planctomycetota bacterium JB042]
MRLNHLRARRGAAALALVLLPACRSIPEIDGAPVNELSPAALLEAAERAFEEERADDAIAAAEWYLTHHFDQPDVERARWVAAEARFGRGELAEAFNQYRRILDENRFTERTEVIGDRAWEIGKTLAREKAEFFDDFGADRDVGIEALNLIVTRYPKDDRADDAWKELAAAFAADGAWAAAADIYERLAREYPGSEWRDLALFRVAEAYARQSRGGSFDVDPLFQADAALARYLAVYPDGNFVAEAEEERLRLQNEITRHELEVAEHYRQRGDPSGERLHLTNAATRFPDTRAAAEARERMAARGVDPGPDSNDLLRPRSERPPWRQGPAPAGAGAARSAGIPAAG